MKRGGAISAAVKNMLTGCGVALFSMLIAFPVSAQEVATLVLRDGQRPSGELIDLNASGFTLRVSGQDRQFPANDVAAVEFVGGAAPPEALARIDAGQPLVVLRSGQIIEGRLSDIGGTRPLRLTVDTPSGQRDFTSNDVAQIYLFATAARVAAAVQPPQEQPRAQQRQQQDQNTQQQQRDQRQRQQDENAQQQRDQRQRQQDQNTQQQRNQRQRQQDQNTQQQRDQQQDQNPHRQGGRLSQQRQQQLVEQQEQRLMQYRQDLDRQQRVLQQQTGQLQQQKRMAQYRFHQEYLDGLRQQQTFLQNDGHPDYDRDPYFYTAPVYRYSRGGRYYETNQYGADLLRQAVNVGYQQGFRAGEADRQDRWRSSYRESYAYQDANYGYNGYYIERDDYNYYFREGFRRGYEDGYSSRYQYGRGMNGSYSIWEAISSQILGFEPLR